MSETTVPLNAMPARKASGIKWKFVIGTLVIVGAMVYLIASNMASNAQYFLTVGELRGKGAPMIGRAVRVSGIVVGDSIEYHADRLHLALRWTT